MKFLAEFSQIMQVCKQAASFFVLFELSFNVKFSLKLECEKLVSEKTEIQRHYVMYYEMSYGLNIEMHKQSEIVKRLNSIIAQILPFLSQEVRQKSFGHNFFVMASFGQFVKIKLTR